MTNEFENENESDTNDNANEYTRMYTDSNDSDAEITEPEETSQVEEIPYGEETPQAEENNTNFIMRSSTESDKAEAKARQQVEKEKIKFEEKIIPEQMLLSEMRLITDAVQYARRPKKIYCVNNAIVFLTDQSEI